MIDLHEKYMREAAAAGVKVMCFQELFYGPYFCQVQDAEYYSYAEAIPDGPTTKRFQELAKELGMVLVLPMYEEEQPGLGAKFQEALEAALDLIEENIVPPLLQSLGSPVELGSVAWSCVDSHSP